ncbi:MAG: hypothetical protein ACFE0S_13680 [Rhodospirillales bacterium]
MALAQAQTIPVQPDLADHFLACSKLGRYLTVHDGSRFVITDDFRENDMGNAAAAAVATIFSRDPLVAQAALLPLGRSGGISRKQRRSYERLFQLIEAQALDPVVTKSARHILENSFREAEIKAIEAELGDKLSPARLRYRAFLGVVRQLLENKIAAQSFLDEFNEFTKAVAGKLDFGIYSFCLDRIFGNPRIPMKVKKLLAVEVVKFPPLIRRELVTNILVYPGQSQELISFVRGLIMAELEPSVVVEIELLETFKQNRLSMSDIEEGIRQSAG